MSDPGHTFCQCRQRHNHPPSPHPTKWQEQGERQQDCPCATERDLFEAQPERAFGRSNEQCAYNFVFRMNGHLECHSTGPGLETLACVRIGHATGQIRIDVGELLPGGKAAGLIGGENSACLIEQQQRGRFIDLIVTVRAVRAT